MTRSSPLNYSQLTCYIELPKNTQPFVMRASNTAMRPACLNSALELTTKQRKMLWSHILHTTLSQYCVTLSEQWHGLCHIDHCSCYQHKNSKFYRNYYTTFVVHLNMCLIIFIRMSKTYIGRLACTPLL